MIRTGRHFCAASMCVVLASAGCGPGKHYDRGRAAEKLGDVHVAYDEYCLAASERPQSEVLATAIKRVAPTAATYWYAQAQIAEAQGRPEDALRMSLRCLKIKPNHDAALEDARTLQGSGVSASVATGQDQSSVGALVFAAPSVGMAEADAPQEPDDRTKPSSQPPVPVAEVVEVPIAARSHLAVSDEGVVAEPTIPATPMPALGGELSIAGPVTRRPPTIVSGRSNSLSLRIHPNNDAALEDARMLQGRGVSASVATGQDQSKTEVLVFAAPSVGMADADARQQPDSRAIPSSPPTVPAAEVVKPTIAARSHLAASDERVVAGPTIPAAPMPAPGGELAIAGLIMRRPPTIKSSQPEAPSLRIKLNHDAALEDARTLQGRGVSASVATGQDQSSTEALVFTAPSVGMAEADARQQPDDRARPSSQPPAPPAEVVELPIAARSHWAASDERVVAGPTIPATPMPATGGELSVAGPVTQRPPTIESGRPESPSPRIHPNHDAALEDARTLQGRGISASVATGQDQSRTGALMVTAHSAGMAEADARQQPDNRARPSSQPTVPAAEVVELPIAARSQLVASDERVVAVPTVPAAPMPAPGGVLAIAGPVTRRPPAIKSSRPKSRPAAGRSLPAGEDKYLIVGKLSTRNERLEARRHAVADVFIELVEVDDTVVALDLYDGDRRTQEIRDLRIGRSKLFRSRSRRWYRLTVISVDPRAETVRIRIESV